MGQDCCMLNLFLMTCKKIDKIAGNVIFFGETKIGTNIISVNHTFVCWL